ncbi:hypothetical protein [Nocardioides sp. YIM 152315]|uniref:hypothetical protein n=1 Tax=Nocardioides sp. YIM 152315 TaxID=3031760 RepID=UPI0023DB5FB0|nr:hypothetical protein [Nocardioides sp. YIM 152315]MDF1605260.1 hypothetical protein [Nocardioides sp. YIM 152315]
MYGDTAAIHGLAGQLRTRAGEIRDAATQLADAIEEVAWAGVAAEAMRGQTGTQVAALRHTAVLHDDAADALDQHADRVAQLQQLIAAIEEKATQLVGAATSRIADLGGDLLDPVDDLLASFLPPPPGHLAWLSVDLPGLS